MSGDVVWLLLPAGASNFTEAMKMGSEIYHHLKSVIKAKYGQDGKVFAVRCYASAAYVVMQCLSVHVSVTFVHSVKTNKYIFKFFKQ